MKQQVLFKVAYCEEISPYDENEVFVLCDGYPGHKELKKRLNMIDYCGEEMSNEDYKEFVVDLGNHKKFNIESVEEVSTIKFNSKKICAKCFGNGILTCKKGYATCGNCKGTGSNK